MLRSQTGGRPAAVSFLRVILALLEDPLPPVDFFGVSLEKTTSLPSDGHVEEACAPTRYTRSNNLAARNFAPLSKA